MAKTTNTKKAPNTQQTAPRPEANSAPNQNKSSLPIVAAVLFLSSELCSALITIYLGGVYRPGWDVLFCVLLVAALFLRRERDLVPGAMILVTLNSLRMLVLYFQSMGISFNFSALAIMKLVSLSMSTITLLLALPNLRDNMSKVWMLPAILGAGELIIVTCMRIDDPPGVLPRCIEVFAYLALCAWLSTSNQSVPDSSQEKSENVSDRKLLIIMLTNQLILGLGLGLIMLAGLAVQFFFDYGNLDRMLLQNSFVFPLCLFGSPVIVLIFLLLKAAKEGKRIKHDINVINSSMGGAIGAQAKAELRKEAGKKAANAVIKGALVGDLIGGDTGAVVGAMAAKAKLDQTTGSDGSMGDVTKGAVVGGIIAGSSGAVVGGLAAQAQKDAEDGIK